MRRYQEATVLSYTPRGVPLVPFGSRGQRKIVKSVLTDCTWKKVARAITHSAGVSRAGISQTNFCVQAALIRREYGKVQYQKE